MAYFDHYPPLTFDDMARAVTAGLGDTSAWFPPASLNAVDTSAVTPSQLSTVVNDQNILDVLNSQLPTIGPSSATDQSIIGQWGAPTATQLNGVGNIPWLTLGLVAGGLILFGSLVGGGHR